MAVSPSATSPVSKPGYLFFFDARSCKDWLKGLPLTNVPQAQQKLLDALRILNRSADFAPLDRLTCLEMLRDKVGSLLSEQRMKYIGKTLPPSNADMAAWNVSNTLLNEMEAGYRRCYQDAQSSTALLGQHAALIIQRIIRYIGLSMMMAGLLYRRFDPAMWMRLHLQFIEAESRDLVNTKIKDSLGTTDGYSTITHAYVTVLLGQLANVHQLSPRDIDFVDAVLMRFANKVSVRPLAGELLPNTNGLVLTVDLLSKTGAGFSAEPLGAEHTRVLDVSELSKSLRRRAKKLSEGAETSTVDLPEEWSPTEAYNKLSQLHKLWCDGNLVQPVSTVPEEADAIVAFGIAETHFFLSGDLFEQPGVQRELTRQEMNDIAMFGRVSESTIRARYAEFNYGTETWPIVDASRDQVRVLRPTKSTRGVAIGRLVGLRRGKDGEFYLSVIRELVEDSPGHITVTLSLLPGKPEAVSVRSAENKARGATYSQGFRLPSMDALGIAETLVVPANTAQRGRGIDIFHQGHGSAKQVTVVDFLERGADFDRVTISG
jgi:hypothetical protein